MRKKRKTSPTLVVLTAMSMVLLLLFGFLLDATVFRGNERYADTPIPALPFIFLFDSGYHDQLAAERMQAAMEGETVGIPLETEPVAAETAPVETEVVEIPVSPPVEKAYVQKRVGTEYFDDALFIGDSRTDGLYLYSRFANADYFSGKGMTVFGLFDKTGRDGETMLMDLLSENTYGKIYVMLGINEIGSNLDLLVKQYASVVERLKELAPDSILVIQGNLSIDEKTSAATWYLTADRIHELNNRLAEFADGERVFFLDPNPLFCDEKGYLKPEVSGDGVHLYAKYYADWTAWLCENGFVAE